MAFPARGSVYRVSFDPTVGSEIRKTRPAAVVSNDVANQYSPIVIVVAITGRTEPKFDEVAVDPPEGGLSKRSVIVANQIRAIDKQRLGDKLGELSDDTMQQLDASLKLTLGMIDL